MNPFDHIKNLHTKKRRWEDFNDEEKKSFNVFIINKRTGIPFLKSKTT